MIPFSVLDLSRIIQGATAGEALSDSLEIAQHAELLGYRRIWFAEHHNMVGVASSATAVIIAYVAGATKRIRVGSGGVMLPNHAPLVIAEQFGTLASIYPDRIDLGLGRAPGTDMATARALRRDMSPNADSFPQDVVELQTYFDDAKPGQQIRAVPGAGLKVPLWLLGSSTFSALLAAQLGLPYAFAAHFAPDEMEQALYLYHNRFTPSKQLDKPYAMICVNVLAADSDAEARRQFSSHQQIFVNLRRGRAGQIPPPLDDIDAWWSPEEKVMADHMLRYSMVGSLETVESTVHAFINKHQPNELMFTSLAYDQAARLRSLEIVAEIAGHQ
jgi:luciferase family oxidoreductase group 1